MSLVIIGTEFSLVKFIYYYMILSSLSTLSFDVYIILSTIIWYENHPYRHFIFNRSPLATLQHNIIHNLHDSNFSIDKNSPLVLANSKTRWNSNCHLAPLGFVNRESSAIYLPIISAHFKGAGKVFELCIKYTSRYVCIWIRLCVCHIIPTSVSNTFQFRVHFWLLTPLNFHKPYRILWTRR